MDGLGKARTMTQTSESTARVIVINPGDPIPPVIDERRKHALKDGIVFDGTNVPVAYLFEYVDRMYSLYSFLDDFPEVSRGQALKAIDDRVKADSVIHSERGRVSGTPVFKGSRVPVRNLFDYLASSDNLDEFLEGFPSVSREQAVEAIAGARRILEKMAYEVAD